MVGEGAGQLQPNALSPKFQNVLSVPGTSWRLATGWWGSLEMTRRDATSISSIGLVSLTQRYLYGKAAEFGVF
jgi:hypothetical protein